MLPLVVNQKIRDYQSNDLIRKRVPFDGRSDHYLYLNNKTLINFSSNDYLGLATHFDIKQAFIQGIQQYGMGSGSSAMISGYFKLQQQLEEKFAEWMKRERAILFNSGYHANLGVIQALTSRHSNILADKLCHASIIDGIRLSQCHHYRYHHTDVSHACEILQSVSPMHLLITESVFSMEGDIAPIPALATLANEYQSLLMVDDAHGFGVIGQSGRGILDEVKPIDCLMTPLGKACGAMGAFVSGKNELIETILQFARTYTYTTALPPAVLLALMASLQVMQKENWRREKLMMLINYFIEQAKQRNIAIRSTDLTPIKTILIGDNHDALAIQQHLIDHGFFVSAIRPPTVPKKTTRIRISLNYYHSENEITQLLDRIYEYLHQK